MARLELPIHEKEEPSNMPKYAPSRPRPSPRKPFILCAILGTFLWSLYALHTGTISLPFMSSSDEEALLSILRRPHTPPAEVAAHRKNMIKLQNLPDSYLPRVGSHTPKERLIVVGDVHGMLGPLEELLAKVNFNKAHDHLILAGDMVSKGPDSKGVVDLAVKLGATGVRGNHEDRVLAAYRGFNKNGEEDEEIELDTEDSEVDGQSEHDVKAAGKRKKDRKLIKHLGRRRIKWLEQCPVILRVGDLGEMGEVVVVHAGLAPGVPLRKQDPEEVMNMRTILPSGKITDGRQGMPWIKARSILLTMFPILM